MGMRGNYVEAKVRVPLDALNGLDNVLGMNKERLTDKQWEGLFSHALTYVDFSDASKKEIFIQSITKQEPFCPVCREFLSPNYVRIKAKPSDEKAVRVCLECFYNESIPDKKNGREAFDKAIAKRSKEIILMAKPEDYEK